MYREWVYLLGRCGKCVCRKSKGSGWIHIRYAGYYAHPSGRIQSFLDRVFYSSGKHFAHKPGASVAVARRGGTATTFDVLNKYFGITQMITVGSTYWNQVHGRNAEDAAKDLEGMQTMRNLGHNMAWVLKCLEAGKEKGLVPPTADRSNQTNFIR